MGQEVLDAFWKSNDRIYNENTLLYHRLARACGLPDCAFWLLYTLRSEEAPLTQTQLSEQLSLPKQTVNSALKKLVEEGVLRLEAADGNLKNKRVCLTEAGEAFLRRTVDRVFGVESAAAARLTEEERSALVALSQKLLDAFRAETEAFLQTAAMKCRTSLHACLFPTAMEYIVTDSASAVKAEPWLICFAPEKRKTATTY